VYATIGTCCKFQLTVNWPGISHFWQQRNMGAVFSTLMVLVYSNVLRLSVAFQFSLIFSFVFY
jgi:hypothetical protein